MFPALRYWEALILNFKQNEPVKTQPGMKIKTVVPLFLLFFLLGSFRFPAGETIEEYSIKAAFIYKFTNYIDWNSHLPGNEFVIGIIGPSPINKALVEIAKTKTVKDKKITIRQYNNPEDIGPCHILFISQKDSHTLDEILAYTSAKGTLTISEKEGYAALGTEINFILADNKLKFEANPKAINAAGLTASSQLLKLAIIVN